MKIATLLLTLALLTVGCVINVKDTKVTANGSSGPIERYQANPWEADVGYRAAVRVGQTLYLSGWAAEGSMDQALANVYTQHAATLQRYGVTFADVVKENLYTKDLEAVKAHNAVRLKFYQGTHPAATWVQVERLYDEKHVLEVELIAQIPLGK